MNLDFVRATYWIGAIVDAAAAAQLLTPVGTRLFGFPGLRAPGAAGQPAVIAAVLMLGWSVLLVWAHLRTRERRTVLATQLVPTLAIQAVLTALFATAIPLARAAALARVGESEAGATKAGA